jgi:hypothetical protein
VDAVTFSRLQGRPIWADELAYVMEEILGG